LKNSFIPRIREILSSSKYEPLNKSELAKALRIRLKERAAFRDALAELENAGEIECGRKSRYRLVAKSVRSKIPSLIGTIQFSRDRKRQSALFLPEEGAVVPGFAPGEKPKIFIPGRLTGTALDGDKVEVHLVAPEPPRWQKPAVHHRGAPPRSASGPISRGKTAFPSDAEPHAKVVRIIERSRTRIVGRFYSKGTRATIVPEDGRLPTSFRLLKFLPEAKQGDIVVADFTGWDSPNSLPTAEMREVLGREDDPGVDILSIIHRYGLPTTFPESVLREAEAIPETIDEAEIARREDWREREVFTIDPEDAKDFDDAICVTERPDGSWELAVHIADVSHYVKPGTALDREARKRGNSVYLADRVLPMLPEKLSNGVCSLKPGVERLTHAAILEFDAAGKQKSARFVSAVIRSHRRYSYEEAFARMKLDAAGIAAIPEEKERGLVEHLQRAWRLGGMLRRKRFANGALDLEFAEVRVVLDERGRAVGVKRSEYDESHQLIEEFMLAANEAVAYETKNAPVPSVYRIHEDPDPGKLQEFAEKARAFGHRLGDVSNRSELQKLLAGIRGKLEEHSLKIALLKSLRRAAYSKDPVGHYGLSKVNYTHFTSPIRRYADLLVHRALRRLLSRRHAPTAPEKADPTPNEGEIGQIAEHISRTERIAADAETDTQRLKLIEYLESVAMSDETTVFEATVFEVKAIGAFAELDGLFVKGLIRKDTLPPWEEYFFDRGREEFRSRTGAPVIGVGQRLKVRLYRVDRSRGFIDFVPVTEGGRQRKKTRRDREREEEG
jgi:ribonuclease R